MRFYKKVIMEMAGLGLESNAVVKYEGGLTLSEAYHSTIETPGISTTISTSRLMLCPFA